MEEECESRLRKEKSRHREKEHSNKHAIKSLVRQLDQEKEKRLEELTTYAELKKSVSRES